MNSTPATTLSATHTPGPWAVFGGKIVDGDSNVIVQRYAYVRTDETVGTITPEEADANARLIAAAPELLATLKRALIGLEAWKAEQERDHPWDVSGWGVEEEVRAAISKAEGR